MNTLFGADEPYVVVVEYIGGPHDGATQPIVPDPYGNLPSELTVAVPAVESLFDPVEVDAPREHVGIYRRDTSTGYRWAGYR